MDEIHIEKRSSTIGYGVAGNQSPIPTVALLAGMTATSIHTPMILRAKKPHFTQRVPKKQFSEEFERVFWI